MFVSLYAPLFDCRSFDSGSFHFDAFARMLEWEDLGEDEKSSCMRKAVAVEQVVREWMNDKVEKAKEKANK